ncbi:putative bifunctional diguanylate cyclase/phosphodiesterase [Pseudorhodoferax aquiterrae]|uniref:putative bifunctional diguanylate cyclase/phosphodiesterase n=1 Tax=Pseudorhodoferax aquiterrae TaxID=747304 RepID=UPI00167A8FEE|nr:EAL domain-containing protein [Pseudorhodoferax aquiterrae]
MVKKIFAGLMALIVSAFLAAGLGFHHFTTAYQERVASQMVLRSTQAFERAVLDRLFAAQRAAASIDSDSDVATAVEKDRHIQPIFSSVSIRETPLPMRGEEGRTARLETAPTVDGPPQVRLLVPAAQGKREVVAVIDPGYLFDHADTAMLNLCLDITDVPLWCPGGRLLSGQPTLVRALQFEPYFRGSAWTVRAQATDELNRIDGAYALFVVAGVVLLAVLLSSIGASVFLRRVTAALATLITANRAAQAGRLETRVQAQSWKDELAELGSSFNGMMEALEASFRYQRVAQELDAGIVAKRPLKELVEMVRDYVRVRGASVGADVTVRPLDQAGHRDDSEAHRTGEHALFTADGVVYEVVFASPVRNPLEIGPVLQETKSLGQRLVIAAAAYAYERQLAVQATTDSLTGLANRFGFIEALQRVIGKGASFDISIVYLDLNGFKELNDAFGHTAGDALLREVAGRLSASLRGTGAVASRLGGDEFAFVIPQDDAATGLGRMQAVFLEPFEIATVKLRLSGSFGVARAPQHGTSVVELLRKADVAMYRAKSSGQAVMHYSEELEGDTAVRLSLVEELRSALERSQFHLVFQPRLHRNESAALSAEVLLRWQHPTLGTVPPAKFIPLAEQHGLIDAIGDWVLAQACQQLASWRKAGLPVAQLSVNVSPTQLLADDFFSRTAALLATWQIEDGGIELEVTESSLVHDVVKASQGMQRLREVGCHIAIDDFGVGFSALSYLNRLPFDTLKVDKSFVDTIHLEPSSKAIAAAIVALAKSLDKAVVAEGVEILEQVAVLRDLGVDEFQGYYFSRPLAKEDFERLVRRSHCKSGSQELSQASMALKGLSDRRPVEEAATIKPTSLWPRLP